MVQEPTKKCPFCGETIHAEALKCRFCKEFLVDEEGLPVSHHDRRIQPSSRPGATQTPLTNRARPAQNESPNERLTPNTILFTGSPSLWGLAGMFTVAGLMLAVGGLLLFFPLGETLQNHIPQMNETVANWIDKIKGLVGMILILGTLARAVYRVTALKRIHYEITPDRIEYTRGIFNRQIDNIDMFRVIDIKLYRTLADCLTGVGTVTLQTNDETDPVFEFEKIAEPKTLYDVIKKASLQADRRQGVIHVD